MFWILLILWFIGMGLMLWGPHQDNKVIGSLLMVIGPAGLMVIDILYGQFFLAVIMAIWAVLNLKDLRKYEIKYGLSWTYALKMTFRRIIGDL